MQNANMPRHAVRIVVTFATDSHGFRLRDSRGAFTVLHLPTEALDVVDVGRCSECLFVCASV